MEHSNNFWEFYTLNQKYVESIIHSVCNHYSSDKINKDDLHQELLITLHRSDFLKRFNPELSKLSTYFYNYVRYRASHIVNSMLSEIKKDKKIGTPLYIDSDEEDNYQDVKDPTAYTPLEYVESEDLKEKIYNSLGSKHRKEIFNFIDLGFSIAEIADIYKNSRMAVQYQWMEIKNITKKLLKDSSKVRMRI